MYSLIAVLMLQFFQDTFTGSESSGLVTVMLQLTGGTSTSDITVTVTPSDVTADGKIKCPTFTSCFIFNVNEKVMAWIMFLLQSMSLLLLDQSVLR